MWSVNSVSSVLVPEGVVMVLGMASCCGEMSVTNSDSIGLGGIMVCAMGMVV